MKKLRVGINGFGRIGRAIFRINHQYDWFDIVAVNDIHLDAAQLAYLLRYDSVHGAFPDTVSAGDEKISVRGRDIAVYRHAGILEVPWRAQGVEVLIDATGLAGNSGAVLSDPAATGYYISTQASAATHMKTLVFGVNEDEFDPARDRFISASICDTVALAPLLKLLEKRHGIESGFLTTLHPWLADQNLLDGHSDQARPPDAVQSHYGLGRSAVNNLIPKSTTAVTAADVLFPGIAQKIESFSYRVPTSIVCSAVLNLVLAEDAERRDVVDLFQRYEREQVWQVISTSSEPKVALDYRGNEFSVAIDQRWTVLKNGRHLRLVYWYDNEWGYGARVADIVRLIARHAAAR